MTESLAEVIGSVLGVSPESLSDDSSIDNVPHVGKTSALSSRSVNNNRLILQSLFYKPGHNHPVLARLSGAYGIEEPRNHNRQSILFVISQSQEFIHGFAAGIGPTGESGTTQHGIVIFAKGNIIALAVHFTR